MNEAKKKDLPAAKKAGRKINLKGRVSLGAEQRHEEKFLVISVDSKVDEGAWSPEKAVLGV